MKTLRTVTTCIIFVLLCGAIPGMTPHISAQSQYPNNYVGTRHGTDTDDAIMTGKLSSTPFGVNVTVQQIISWHCFLRPTFGPDDCSNNPQIYAGMLKSSVTTNLANIVSSTYYYPPANTYAFIEHMGQSLGFMPKSVHAQGIGFSGFESLLKLWQVFRNIAYGLIAIVMVAIGFMVMFRKKIDPKTVVTVQNAVPRIIVTLILITFSYAIVGIVIDLMYVVIFLCISLFKSTGLLPDPSGLTQLFSMFSITTPEQLYGQSGLLPNLVTITERASIYRIFGADMSNLVGGAAFFSLAAVLAAGGAIISGPAGAAVGGILGLGVPVIQLLLDVAILLLFIRLVFFFVGTYIQIIISLLFGPIQLLFGAIPGNDAFSSWFKNLIANVAVFPLAAIMFMLSNIFVKFGMDATGNIWTPPYAGIINNPLSITTLVALGLLFYIPSLGAQLKERLKTKPFVQAGPEGIAGTLGQPLQIGWQLFSYWSSHEQMKNLGKQMTGDKK